MVSKTLLTSKTDDWSTPQDFFDKLNDDFNFTVDVCASHTNHKCDRYYTKEHDGLTHDWSHERVWMNPPYGKDISKWMKKAYESSKEGALVVCLVPSRTDTRWWHDYAMKGDITFVRGRLKFGGATNAAPFPSAVVTFYPEYWSEI